MLIAKGPLKIQSTTMLRLTILAISCLLFAAHAISARITLDCGDIFCVLRIVHSQGSSLNPGMDGKSVVCLSNPHHAHQGTHLRARNPLSQYSSRRPKPSPKARVQLFAGLRSSRIIEISSMNDHWTSGRLRLSQRLTAVSSVTTSETAFHSLMTLKNQSATTSS